MEATDKQCLAVAEAYHAAGHIQGFHNRGCYVIRDTSLVDRPWNGSELWRGPDQGQAAREAFERQLKIEKMRRALRCL